MTVLSWSPGSIGLSAGSKLLRSDCVRQSIVVVGGDRQRANAKAFLRIIADTDAGCFRDVLDDGPRGSAVGSPNLKVAAVAKAQEGAARGVLRIDLAVCDYAAVDGIMQSDLIELPVVISAGGLEVDAESGRCCARSERSIGGVSSGFA